MHCCRGFGPEDPEAQPKEKSHEGVGDMSSNMYIYIVYTHSFEYTRSTFFFGPQGGVIDIMSCNKAKVRMVTFAFGESCNPIVKW